MTFTGLQARPQLWTEKRISEAKAEGSSNVEAKWEYFHVSTYCMVAAAAHHRPPRAWPLCPRLASSLIGVRPVVAVPPPAAGAAAASPSTSAPAVGRSRRLPRTGYGPSG